MAATAAEHDQLVPGQLAGKVAIVSGSSSGIGAAIARELSRRGARVVINYPDTTEEDSARNVLGSLSTAAESITVKADLAALEGPKALATATADKFGKVDILVNNAGRSTICSLSEASDAEVLQAWDKTVNLNGRGTMLLTRAVLPHLATEGSRIINIGSSQSRDPEADMDIYAGTKGMIESFTRCWAREFPRKYGCTVNTVAPGPVGTEALLAAPPDFLNHVLAGQQRVPVQSRLARPEEIAWLVAELCDEKARWLNGLYVLATGGHPLC